MSKSYFLNVGDRVYTKHRDTLFQYKVIRVTKKRAYTDNGVTINRESDLKFNGRPTFKIIGYSSGFSRMDVETPQLKREYMVQQYKRINNRGTLYVKGIRHIKTCRLLCLNSKEN